MCVSETWIQKYDIDVDIEMPDYTTGMYRRGRRMNSYEGLVTFCTLGQERVYLPLYKMADNPFISKGRYVHDSVNSSMVTCFESADSGIMYLEIN